MTDWSVGCDDSLGPRHPHNFPGRGEISFHGFWMMLWRLGSPQRVVLQNYSLVRMIQTLETMTQLSLRTEAHFLHSAIVIHSCFHLSFRWKTFDLELLSSTTHTHINLHACPSQADSHRPLPSTLYTSLSLSLSSWSHNTIEQFTASWKTQWQKIHLLLFHPLSLSIALSWVQFQST